MASPIDRRALRRELLRSRAPAKIPVDVAYVVHDDYDDIPHVYRIAILSRSDKQVRVIRSQATNSRSNFDTEVFDRHFLPTREAAIAYWRRRTQEAIEHHLRDVRSLREQLAIEPKDAKR